MVELGNHQGRPPGGQQPLLEMNSELSSVSLSSSLLDHWINQDIASLDFLDGLCTQSSVRTNESSTYNETTQYAAVTIKEEPADIGALGTEKQLLMLQMKNTCQISNNLPLWGFPMDVDSLKLDDVFQVDQSDLVQSPTLAELNSEKEPFFELEFGDLDFDEVIIPDIVTTDNKKEYAKKDTVAKYVFFDGPTKMENAGKSVAVKTEPSEMMAASRPEDDFVEEEEESKSTVSKGKDMRSLPLPIPGRSVRSRRRTLSSTELSVTSSVSSNDEGFGSQAEDTDTELLLASDTESLVCDDESQEDNPISPSSSSHGRSAGSSSLKNGKSGSHKKRYFWQYNIQSKGPKGPRMPMNTAQLLDPHILNDVTDPVFSTECHLEGVKHAGKARRGDGNDLTPNPQKLHSIGVELKSLNKMINELSAACDLPGNVKPKSRKEKNKLASRSCRLKKKAQHEANKLKLFGLQQEHAQLMNLMGEVKTVIQEMKCKTQPLRTCQQTLQKVLERKGFPTVAGNTAEYVNSVLDKVASGQPVSGLDSF